MCSKLWREMNFFRHNGECISSLLQEIQSLFSRSSVKCVTCQYPLDDRLQRNQNAEHMHVDAWKCRMMMPPRPGGAQD